MNGESNPRCHTPFPNKCLTKVLAIFNPDYTFGAYNFPSCMRQFRSVVKNPTFKCKIANDILGLRASFIYNLEM